MANSMAATQAIHDHVREGRVTPEQGATLLEVRRELDEKRARHAFRGSLVAQAIALLGAFVLIILGIRRD